MLLPFDRYPADPVTITVAAAQVEFLARKPAELLGSTLTSHLGATASWSGFGLVELLTLPGPVRRSAEQAMSAITWAAVPMRYWATRISGFNTEVDRLVAALAEQSQTAAEDHEAASADSLDQIRAQAVAAAQAAYRLAEATYITAGRDTTIAMIRQGPTPENLAAAGDAGVIPPESTMPVLWGRTPPPNDTITVVDLNAGMGHGNEPGDTRGTDATEEDLTALAAAILAGNADVATLQEMDETAANWLEQILQEMTGDEWTLYFAQGTTTTVYPTNPDGSQGQPFEDAYGNATLVRTGDGVASSDRIDLEDPELPEADDSPEGRNVLGVTVTSEQGSDLSVYNTHISPDGQASDGVQAEQIAYVQEVVSADPNPVLVAGDMNQTTDELVYAPDVEGSGIPAPLPLTEGARAILDFTEEYGYDNAGDAAGPTYEDDQIDYIFTRGVDSYGTELVDGAESDHDGIGVTVDLDG